MWKNSKMNSVENWYDGFVDYYKSRIEKYLEYFNLKNWDYEIFASVDEKNFGLCCASIIDKLVVFEISIPILEEITKNLKSDNVYNDVISKIDKVAFHEVMELMLFKIRQFGLENANEYRENEMNEEIHSIIRTLENTIYKLIK